MSLASCLLTKLVLGSYVNKSNAFVSLTITIYLCSITMAIHDIFNNICLCYDLWCPTWWEIAYCTNKNIFPIVLLKLRSGLLIPNSNITIFLNLSSPIAFILFFQFSNLPLQELSAICHYCHCARLYRFG